MKRSKYIFTLTFFFFSFFFIKYALGQDILDKKVTINIKNKNLKKALYIISRESEVSINFVGKVIPRHAKVTINAKSVPLGELLKKILTPESLTYLVFNNNIVIRPLTGGRSETQISNRSYRDSVVHGSVSDLKDKPLTGVTVSLKGTKKGAITDETGSYSLHVKKKDTLVFSYLGFKTEVIPVNGRSLINVSLKAVVTGLNQLVVIGYGTALKKNLSTSIGTIGAAKLMQRPTSLNIFQGMAGKVAGVNIMLNSGAPGGSPVIKIRGAGSLNSSNEPLYVVDGVVGVNPDIINLNVIKSIDILKDAAASAIYGARGANGVVVITTKKGNKNTTNISYSTTLSVGTLAGKVDVLDAKKSLEVFKRAYGYMPGRIAPHLDPNNNFPHKTDLFNPDGTPKYNTDWQDVVTRTAFSHKHSLTFSGGGDQLTALANITYSDNQGIMRNTYRKKSNAFLSIDWDLKDWFHLQGMLNVGTIKGRNSENSISRYALENLPFLPVKYPDGTYSRKGDYPGAEDTENPVKILKQRKSIDKNQFTLANLIGTFDITPHLKLTTSFSAQDGANMNSFYAPSTLFGYGQTQNGRAERIHSRYNSWSNEDYLTYEKQWNRHHLNVVAGASWYAEQSTFTDAGSENFFDDFFEYYNMGVGTVRSIVGSGYEDSKMNSYYARAHYGYNDRYLLGMSFREDGSSRFGQNNKYGFFPSFSAAWRISNERFFSTFKPTINDLKLRLSYGTVGNAKIGNYMTMGRFGNSLIPFDKKMYSAVTLAEIGNPDLKWEKSTQFDVGLNVSLLDGRIEMIADYYSKITTDLLYRLQLPSTTGYESTMTNLGKIRNNGFELTLNTRNIQTKNFLWTTNFVYMMNHSMVVDINDNIIPKWGGRIQEGEPLNMLYGYVRLGTWGTDEAAEAAKYNKKPGDLKYWDKNDNGIKDGGDQTFLGSAMPKFDMNMTNSFFYKGFTFMFDLHWMYGNKLINFTRQLMGNRVTFSNSYAGILKNAWTPDHQGGMVASLRLPGDGYENDVDSWSCEPGSFLRVRNIGLKYTFNNQLLSKFDIKTLSIGLNVRNAFLFTRYSGSDPEVTSFDPVFEQGVDFYSYPKPRTFAFTLDVNF